MRRKFPPGGVLGLIAALAHIDATAVIEVRGIVARGVQKFIRAAHWQCDLMNSNALIRGEKGFVNTFRVFHRIDCATQFCRNDAMPDAHVESRTRRLRLNLA
jgi:hypothetical protein